MKTTNYAGIDYGLGKTNVGANGIRYGVISQHSINPDCDDVYTNGRDLTFENYQQSVKDSLKSALSDYFSDHAWNDRPSSLANAVANAFDAIEQDINDRYESDGEGQYLYEQDGYTIQTCLTNDYIVTQSPYFTYAQFCSPCIPGACNLDSPLAETDDNNKCFCLGHDWFDDGKAPYPVYSVETGAIIPATANP